MLVAACPQCGAEIRFRSASLPVKVCDFCRSAVVREGDDLKAMGEIATVPGDVSPLQIGTRGRAWDCGFELTGRVRWRWTDGAWSEWLMLFDDGSTGWLGEAMGRFMVLREAVPGRNKLVDRIANNGEVVIGTRTQLSNGSYEVSDAREVMCLGSEGELPFAAPLGLRIYSVDLLGADRACASIQRNRGTVSLYLGTFMRLAELKPTNLREIEGWPVPRFAA